MVIILMHLAKFVSDVVVIFDVEMFPLKILTHFFHVKLVRPLRLVLNLAEARLSNITAFNIPQ